MLTNFSILSIEQVVAAIWKLMRKRIRFNIQRGYAGVLLGTALVIFERPPGFYRAEVPCQDLPIVEKGKAPIWKASLSGVSLKDRCCNCSCFHSEKEPKDLPFLLQEIPVINE